jgi:hypothetical protein
METPKRREIPPGFWDWLVWMREHNDCYVGLFSTTNTHSFDEDLSHPLPDVMRHIVVRANDKSYM